MVNIDISGDTNYLEAKATLKTLRTRMTQCFSYKEIKALNDLKQHYVNALNTKDAKKKLDNLCNALIITSSHRERLTSISNDLTLISRDINVLIKVLTRKLSKHEDYFTLKKQDRDLLVENSLGVFTDFSYKLDHNNDIIATSVEYLDKLEFNLKSIVSCLKQDYGS